MTEAAPDTGDGLRALVLAAGYGTRLAPVTDHLPKPLLPVGGVPLLDGIIARILAAGILPIAVNSHHLGALVGAHLAGHRQSRHLIHFPEAEILGTGGALDNAREFLSGAPRFLIHNGDVLCDVDLRALVAAHESGGALATLLLVDWPAVNSVTLGVDGAVRHIAGTADMPPAVAGDRQLTYAGIGVFERALLDDIGPGFSSLIDPLVRALHARPDAVCGYAPAEVSWDDLGTLDRWLRVAGDDTRTVDGFRLARITGHGSDRRFWRLGRNDWSAVAMVCPPEDQEFARFLAVGRFLASQDLGPAEFLSVDNIANAVLMEDLGPTSLYSIATAPDTPPVLLQDRYRQAVDHLLALQQVTPQARLKCPLAVDRTLDLTQLRWETGYFREHFLAGHLGLAITELDSLEAEFKALADSVAAAPVALIHRDFQSQNILFQEARVRLVDFQGLRLGPITYDLASLVWDPYVDISAVMRQDLVTRFAGGCPVAGPDEIRAMTVAAGLQRVMQALGAFAFLGQVKGKAGFLAHVPAAVRHLQLLLGELAVLQESAGAIGPDVADCLPGSLTNLTRLIAREAQPESGDPHA